VSALGRYARTLRHLTAGQVGWRVVHEVRLRAYRARPEWFRRLWLPDERARMSCEPLARPPAELLERERLVGELWRSGRVRYLGIEAARYDWKAAARPRLWRYERHYHAELVGLAALSVVEPERRWLEEGQVLITSWASECPAPSGDAWEPYPVARRVLNWSLAAALEPGLRDLLSPLLAPQLRFLRWHLERHLLGNHLLCDAAALMAGGAVLDGPGGDAAMRQGAALLARELPQQVLADGCYAERSPQYHVIVLRDVLLALGLAGRRGYAADPRIGDAARAMARWLSLVRRGDALPWLNDAAPDATPPLDEVLSLAAALHLGDENADGWLGRAFGAQPRPAPPPPRSDLELPDTGWSIVRDGSSELLFEHGPIGPDEQPGHGHSDALSYELIWEGAPMVTDTGVTTYDANGVRAFERSARAHACVTVAGEGADEIWASFRVGARGRVEGGPIRSRAPARVLRGRVASPFGWTHERGIVFLPGQAFVVLDAVAGAGGREVLSHVPLDEAVDARGGELRAGGRSLLFAVLRGTALPPVRGSSQPRGGWIGRGFGVAHPRTTLTVRAASGQSAYTIQSTGVEVVLEEKRLIIRAPGCDAAFPLGASGLPE
jgi:hypothetical protein